MHCWLLTVLPVLWTKRFVFYTSCFICLSLIGHSCSHVCISSTKVVVSTLMKGHSAVHSLSAPVGGSTLGLLLLPSVYAHLHSFLCWLFCAILFLSVSCFSPFASLLHLHSHCPQSLLISLDLLPLLCPLHFHCPEGHLVLHSIL